MTAFVGGWRGQGAEPELVQHPLSLRLRSVSVSRSLSPLGAGRRVGVVDGRGRGTLKDGFCAGWQYSGDGASFRGQLAARPLPGLSAVQVFSVLSAYARVDLICRLDMENYTKKVC